MRRDNAAARAVETSEQTQQRLEQDRIQHAATRAIETHEKTQQRLEQDRIHHAVNRQRVFQARLEKKNWHKDS